jgi:pimeloyl-ACP methyl ester carboxylesterase
MPAVLIHGVPDTTHVWDAVREHLSRKDSIPLALPGFDGPLPQGFMATKEEYVRWIIARLEAIGQPVDLVGHDWGCILTMRVASLRPDLVRSWAAGSGPVSGTYEWHPLAKIWQSPGEGEKWMRDLNPSDLAAFMAKSGLPPGQAKETVERIDDTMKQSILRLYRSAVEVGKEWQPDLAKASSPGLVFWGEHDAACPVAFAHELGKDAGASRVLTFDADHWVIIERSAEVALALEEHWASAAV